MNDASVKNLLSLSFPDGCKPGVILMLQFYFDDSGTHDGSPVVTWGGVAGTVEQISAFSRDWKSLLVSPLPERATLHQFHLTECLSAQGEFEGYSRTAQDAIRHDFRQIIKRHDLSLIGYSVSVADWNNLVTGSALRWFGSAERVAISGCISATLKIADQLGHDEVAIWLDGGRKSKDVAEVADMAHQENRFRITGVTFSSVQTVPALQGADMAAYEARLHYVECLRNGDKAPHIHLARLVDGMKTAFYVLNRDAIKANVDRFNQNPPRLFIT